MDLIKDDERRARHAKVVAWIWMLGVPSMLVLALVAWLSLRTPVLEDRHQVKTVVQPEAPVVLIPKYGDVPKSEMPVMTKERWFQAINDADLRMVQAFIAAGLVNVDSKDSGGRTGLEFGAAAGRPEILAALLTAGASQKGPYELGLTPLHLAARKGCLECVRLLVEHGAALDAKVKGGDTALIIASYDGHEDIVRLLVKSGANLKLRNRDGDTALRAAQAFRHDGIAAFLRRSGG